MSEGTTNFLSMRDVGLPRKVTGSSTLSITRCHSSNVGDWNTKPSCGPGSVSSAPRKVMRPVSGRSRPAASLSSVVLPQPLRPTRQWNSPSRTSQATPCTTGGQPGKV